MHRRGVLAFPLALIARAAARGNPASGDPRKEKLFSLFMAPCCWRQNLLVHQSPRSEELRQEIVKLMAEGRSDDEIKNAFIQRYSLRILALPEGTPGQWLAWIPKAGWTAGLCAVIWFIHRSTKQAQTLAISSGEELPALPETEWL